MADATPDVTTGDHYRAGPDADLQPGVYRVVGVGDGEVTLLRVTDADGRRAHTGEVASVPAGAVGDALRPADDPDAGFHPVRAVVGALEGMVWEVRALLGV